MPRAQLLTSQGIGREAAERSIQDLDRVDYRCLFMPAGERGLKLKGAAWVAGGNNIGLERRNEFGLAVTEGIGGVRLNKIVDSCRATADGGLGNFRELDSRNACEQSPRLRAHALRMLQMAGIVERYAQF